MRTPRNEALNRPNETVRPERSRGTSAPRVSTSLDTNGEGARPPSPDPSRKREGNGPERTCILTRRAAPKDTLFRLALSPDGEVAPDVRARAPGRGAYIGVGQAELEASAKKLKGALARAFKQDVAVPGDLATRIAAALRQNALDRLGMEARAGTLITGAERIEQAARAGKVHLLIHAADAGADGNRTLDQAARVGGGVNGLVFPEGRTILSVALGRENVVHLALTDPAAARRVRDAIDRWLAFIEPEPRLEGGAAAPAMAATTNDDEGQA